MAGNNTDDDIRVRVDVDTPATLGDVFDQIQNHNEDSTSHPTLVEHTVNTDIHVTSDEKAAWNSLTPEKVDEAIEKHNDSTIAHNWLFNNKVDKITGKGLSTNDFTDAEKTKLASLKNLEQVQTDWKQTDKQAKDYLKNKPLALSEFDNDLGFITEESDPVFKASPAFSLTTEDTENIKNIPEKDAEIQGKLDTKVDKEEGKSLTSNDFTDLLKEKLEALPEPASIAIKSVQSINNLKPDSNGNVELSKEDIGLGQLINETQVTRSEKGVPEGVATLGQDGKIPDNQIPEIAISRTHKVDSQVAMLALEAQVGDVAIRTDENKTYKLADVPANSINNWLEILAPKPDVTSVAGKKGDVVLNKTDVGLDNVDNTSDVNKPISALTQRALDAKADITYVDSKVASGHSHDGVNSKKISYTDILGTPEPLQDVVYSPDSTKILKIRENAEANFQYSTDGVNWKEIKTDQTTVKKDTFIDEEFPLEYLRLTDKVRHPAFLTINVNGEILVESEYTLLADEQTIQLKNAVAINTPVEVTYFLVAVVDDNTIRGYADSAANSAVEASGYIDSAKKLLSDYETIIAQYVSDESIPSVDSYVEDNVKPTINSYVTTNVIPSIDDLVEASANSQVAGVLEKNVAPVIDNYMETDVKPAIDSYVNETSKQQINTFVDSEVMPGINTKVDQAIDEKTDLYYENVVKPQVDNEIQTQVSEKVGAYVDEKAPEIVDTYLDEVSKPKLDTYVEETCKPALDTYVNTELETVINDMAKNKTDEVVLSYLETDIKPAVDSYYESDIKPAVEQQVQQTVQPIIDNYVDTAAKPALDNYVNNDLQPIIATKAEEETSKVVQDYLITDLAPAVDEYFDTDIKPKINDYVETTSKPSIDSYVAENIMPSLESKVDTAVDTKVSEYIASEISPALDSYVDTTSIPRIQNYVDETAIPSISLKVDLAEQWATKTDAPVEGQEYSAKWWAGQASSIVTGTTYTKEQIDSKLDYKQDTLSEGDYISIQSNVVSLKVDDLIQTFTQSAWDELEPEKKNNIKLALILEEE